MSDSTASVAERQPSTSRSRRWKRGVVLGVVAGVAALLLVVWFKPAVLVAVARLVRGENVDPAARQQAEQLMRAQDEQHAAVEPASRDDEYRQKMLGRWTQSTSDADRELTLDADGTGLQVIKPKGWVGTSLLGERVELDVLWKVEDGRAIFDSTTGRPADKAARVNELFGSHRNRRIVEINDERILLFDEKDGKPSEWRRRAE